MIEQYKESLMKLDNGNYYNYIEQNILPKYINSKAHNISHIIDVTNRALTLNKNLNLNLDIRIISACTFYHDIGRMIDDETHEIISAKIFMEDKEMDKFFTSEEKTIISDAIEDHRASLKTEPRNIYGKLLSSSDKNTKVEQALKRTYEYSMKKNPDISIDEKVEQSYNTLNKKFGLNGYASVYFDDGVYKKYIGDLRQLLNNYESFKQAYLKANNLF